jgi:hypothetical protein
MRTVAPSLLKKSSGSTFAVLNQRKPKSGISPQPFPFQL